MGDGRPPPGRLRAWVRHHPLGAFYGLAFAVSWGYWVPVALAGGHWSHAPGLLGPMAAGVVVTAVTRGRPGLRDLLARATRWRVPLHFYAAAGLLLAASAVAVALRAAAGGDLPTVHELGTTEGLPAVGWLGVFALLLVVNGYGEEVGWRGWAWPQLRRRHALAGAAALLTVPWAAWHLPTFWIDSGLRGFPLAMVPGWLLGMAAGAVVLGRLYEHAEESLLVVALWHAALNMGSATVAAQGLPAAVVTTVVVVWAVRILRREHAIRTSTAGPLPTSRPPTGTRGAAHTSERGRQRAREGPGPCRIVASEPG